MNTFDDIFLEEEYKSTYKDVTKLIEKYETKGYTIPNEITSFMKNNETNFTKENLSLLNNYKVKFKNLILKSEIGEVGKYLKKMLITDENIKENILTYYNIVNRFLNYINSINESETYFNCEEYHEFFDSVYRVIKLLFKYKKESNANELLTIININREIVPIINTKIYKDITTIKNSTIISNSNVTEFGKTYYLSEYFTNDSYKVSDEIIKTIVNSYGNIEKDIIGEEILKLKEDLSKIKEEKQKILYTVEEKQREEKLEKENIEKNRKRRNKNIVAIILSLSLISGVYYMNNTDKKENSNNNNSTTIENYNEENYIINVLTSICSVLFAGGFTYLIIKIIEIIKKLKINNNDLNSIKNEINSLKQELSVLNIEDKEALNKLNVLITELDVIIDYSNAAKIKEYIYNNTKTKKLI